MEERNEVQNYLQKYADRCREIERLLRGESGEKIRTGKSLYGNLKNELKELHSKYSTTSGTPPQDSLERAFIAPSVIQAYLRMKAPTNSRPEAMVKSLWDAASEFEYFLDRLKKTE